MANWRNIHLDFTRKLKIEWEIRGFDYDSCKEWIDIGLTPSNADYAQWLRDELEVEAEYVLNHESKEILRELYQKYLEERDCSEKKDSSGNSDDKLGENWQSIHSRFTFELQKQWKEKGFSCKETKEWIDIGLNIKDSNFANYLKSQEFTSKEFLNYGYYGKWELVELREKYIADLCKRLQEFSQGFEEFCQIQQKGLSLAQLVNEKIIGVNRKVKELNINLIDKQKKIINLLKSMKELLKKSKSELLEKAEQTSYNQEEREIEQLTKNVINLEKEKQILEEEGEKLLETTKELQLVEETVGSKLSEGKKALEQLAELVTREREKLNRAVVEFHKNYVEISEKESPEYIYSREQTGGQEGVYTYYTTEERWEDLGFNRSERNQWIDYSLKNEDAEFAYYLKKQGHISEENLDYEKLREEYNRWERNLTAQQWLDYFYPKEREDETTGIDIEKNQLEGDLVIEGRNSLEYLKLSCRPEKTASIKLTNLPKLTVLIIRGNKTYYLTITNCPKINFLNISNNYLTNLDFLTNLNPNEIIYLNVSHNAFSPQDLTTFRKFTNLKFLSLENNFFQGSLEPLKSLKKLQYLDISYTGVNNGLEYLPESLEKIKSNSLSATLLIQSDPLVDGNSMKWAIDMLPFSNPDKTISNFFRKYKSSSQFSQLFSTLQGLRQRGESYIIALIKTRHLNINKELEEYKIKEPYKSWIEFYNIKAWREVQPFYKQLKKVLNGIGYSSLSETGKDIFFNVRRGYFQISDKDTFSLLQQINLIDDRAKFSENCFPYLVGVTSTDTEKYDRLESLIRKRIKIEDLKRIDFFPTWFNPNCAIVVEDNLIFNKNADRIWIVVYETSFGKVKEKINWIKAMGWVVKDREKQEKIIEDFKQSLNTEHPSLSLNNKLHEYNLFTSPSFFEIKNVAVRKINLSDNNEPSNYLKPYDIVKRKIDVVGISHHYAVYLGKDREGVPEVVHISGEKEIMNRFGDFSDLYARTDTWEKFLNNEKKIEVYHPFIPFKETEIIKKHVSIAINTKYGKGEYDLLGNNCEHFATMCVYGLGICQQKNLNTLNKVIKKSDYLSGEATRENNRFFESLKVDEFVSKEKPEKRWTTVKKLFKKSKANQDWVSVHQDFQNAEIEKTWINRNFTLQQCKEWIDIGLKPADAGLASWLRDTKHLTPEQVLNRHNLEQLNQEFFNWWQEQQQAQIEQSPK